MGNFNLGSWRGCALVALCVPCQASIEIIGYDSVSSFLIPFGAPVGSTSSNASCSHGEVGTVCPLGDISAVAFTSRSAVRPAHLNCSHVTAASVLLLSDRSGLFSADLLLGCGRLLDVTLTDFDMLDSSVPLDAEGLVLLGKDAWVSTEGNPGQPFIFHCPLSGGTSSIGPQARSPCKRSAFNTSTFASATANKGLESLTASAALLPSDDKVHFVTANEYHLPADDARTIRLAGYDVDLGQLFAGSNSSTIPLPDRVATSGEVAYVVSEFDPALGVVELLALDHLPLDPTQSAQFLALERGYSRAHGNEVRLYLVSTAHATDVSRCSLLGIDTCHSDGTSVQSVHKELIFQWNLLLPLGGQVRVDNYEGMSIVPESVAKLLGAVDNRNDTNNSLWLLLVNDNNSNKEQIGTQLVLLRLNTRAGVSPLSSDPSSGVSVSPSPPDSTTKDDRKATVTVFFAAFFLLGFLLLAALVLRQLRKTVCVGYGVLTDQDTLVSDPDKLSAQDKDLHAGSTVNLSLQVLHSDQDAQTVRKGSVGGTRPLRLVPELSGPESSLSNT